MSTRRDFLVQTAAAGISGATFAPFADAATKTSWRTNKPAASVKAAAVVFVAKDKTSIQNLDVPLPGAHEIQVQSVYSTISAGTENLILHGRVKGVQFPCVPGYQRSGVVTAVGTHVQGWKIGQRALALIGSWSNSKVTSASGGHVAVANTSTDSAYHLSDEVNDVDASCGVVAQVGYNAASRATVNAGDWVLIYGDGLVGQCGAQAARAKGARTILVGRREERLELALKYSADVVINGKEEVVVPAVRKVVGSQTVPVIIDTVQTLDSQKEYISLLEHGRGQVVYSGYSPGEQWADMTLLNDHELTTHFISGWTRDRMEATLELMKSGRIRVSPLITHLVPYARAPDMYRMIVEKNVPFLGITLDWRPSS